MSINDDDADEHIQGVVAELRSEAVDVGVEVDALTKLIDTGRAQSKKLRLELRELNQQLAALKDARSDKTLLLEVALVGSKPWYWSILLVICIGCLWGTIASKNWLMVPFNFLAYALIWRTLYVKGNGASIVGAILICAFTLLY